MFSPRSALPVLLTIAAMSIVWSIVENLAADLHLPVLTLLGLLGLTLIALGILALVRDPPSDDWPSEFIVPACVILTGIAVLGDVLGPSLAIGAIVAAALLRRRVTPEPQAPDASD